jgi:hypothetical protein
MLCMAGCLPPPPQMPAGWPLAELTLPEGARPVEFAKLEPPNRPYYSGSSDEVIKPALAAMDRLLGSAGQRADIASRHSYSARAVTSEHGDTGIGWGICFDVPGGGFDNTLAICEKTLNHAGYSTVDYVPGMLRTYLSLDRRTEVVLVAGRRWQLLLAVNEFDLPLPGELEQVQREDAARFGRELAELIQTEALERSRR